MICSLVVTANLNPLHSFINSSVSPCTFVVDRKTREYKQEKNRQCCAYFFIYLLCEKVTKLERFVALNIKVCKNMCVFKHTVHDMKSCGGAQTEQIYIMSL